MEKEIIGYKLKESCNGYYRAVGQLNISFSVSRSMLIDKYPTVINNLKKAGVLDLWFDPIYKEEFKVGDWVVVINDGFNIHGQIKNGDIKKITSRDKVNNLYDWGVSFSDGSNGGHNRSIYECLRKATPEEIKLAQEPLITINDYKGEFFDEYILFGCAKISKDLILSINTLMSIEESDRYPYKPLNSIIIGKGTFTKEQIKEIAEYYLNKD